MKLIEKSIGSAATKIANEIDASCIISIEQKEKDKFKEDHFLDVKVNVFKKVKPRVYSKLDYLTKTRKTYSSSIIPIKEILMEGINKSYIKKGDKVVCVADESIGFGYKGLLFIFDVDKVFFDISTHNLAENINPDVIEAVIDIALEISKEGREGRKIGTGFIICDKEEIKDYIKQLIINPFAGYSEEVKNITNPELKETIKEFSQLDGVFVIDKNGVILSGGSYIDVHVRGFLYQGLGTRHRCCAALTNKIDALAVVVSQSGGVIRIFKKGDLIMKLP